MMIATAAEITIRSIIHNGCKIYIHIIVVKCAAAAASFINKFCGTKKLLLSGFKATFSYRLAYNYIDTRVTMYA